MFRKDLYTEVPARCLFFSVFPFEKDLAKRIFWAVGYQLLIFPSHFGAAEFGKETFECGDF